MMKKKSIEELFGRLCRYFGYDWNEIMKQNSINGTLGDHMSLTVTYGHPRTGFCSSVYTQDTRVGSCED